MTDDVMPTVPIRVEWRSEHDITPPDGESAEDFCTRLDLESVGAGPAWEHALDQVDSSTAELANWETRG